MNKEKTEQLKTFYPHVFKLAQEPFLSEGFRCEDGWFLILNNLFRKLNKLIEETNLQFVLAQVKEKFGELRVYSYGGNHRTEKLINASWKKSMQTCEKCGEEGEVRYAVNIKCLCDNCFGSITYNID